MTLRVGPLTAQRAEAVQALMLQLRRAHPELPLSGSRSIHEDTPGDVYVEYTPYDPNGIEELGRLLRLAGVTEAVVWWTVALPLKEPIRIPAQ